MFKAFQYKASRSKGAALAASRQLALCAELWNGALEERRDHWQKRRVSITYPMQTKQLPAIKAARPEFAEIGSQVLTDVLRRLDKAFQAFFRRVKAGETPGYPRFKPARRYDSLTFRQECGWKLGPVSASGKKRSITMQGIGTFRLFWSRDLEGEVKTVTLKRDRCGDWFVTFACDDVPARPLPTTGATVGIDLGLESFLTTSDGAHVANPRPLRAASAGLRKAQRVVSKRVRGGVRRRKAVVLLAKRHRRVERVRRDFHHHVARQLVMGYDLIAVEALNVSALSRGWLAKSVSDAGWGEFLAILADKAVSAGRVVVAVDPRGTSQVCNACGAAPAESKPLKERRHACACGYVAHRDVNAALNIRQRGEIQAGRAGPSASGRACKDAAST